MKGRRRLSKREAGTDRRKHRPDYGLVVVIGLLLLLGLVTIFAISPALVQRGGASDLIGGDHHYAYRQLLAVLIGVGVFATLATVPLTFWQKIQPLLIVGALALSTVILIPGVGQEISGATRWIIIGPLSLQPSELVKFALVIYLASFLSERIRKKTLGSVSETLKPILVITFGLALLIAVFQKDLGTMVSIVSIILFMYFMSGAAMKNIGIYAGAVFAAALAAVVLFPHRLQRVLTFIDPYADIDGAGYQINQALIAIGSGGLFGVGLGRSVQVFGYLPAAANDSIFAILAEVLGFVGATVVIILFGVLFVRLLKIMATSTNTYMKLLVAGVFGWLFSHTVINIGSMLGLLPLTGIPLPFLSLGGTSLVMMMAALGLVFNISRYTSLDNKVKESKNARSRNRRRFSRAR